MDKKSFLKAVSFVLAFVFILTNSSYANYNFSKETLSATSVANRVGHRAAMAGDTASTAALTVASVKESESEAKARQKMCDAIDKYVADIDRRIDNVSNLFGMRGDALGKVEGHVEGVTGTESFKEAYKKVLLDLKQLIQEGKIAPQAANMRYRKNQADSSTSLTRPVSAYFFAGSANPFHHAHTLLTLRAMVTGELDFNLNIIHGNDLRKVDFAPYPLREEWAKKVEVMLPLLQRNSDIADREGFDPLTGNTTDANGSAWRNYLNPGEENTYLLLMDQDAHGGGALRVYYGIGSDHFKIEDMAKGKPEETEEVRAEKQKDTLLRHYVNQRASIKGPGERLKFNEGRTDRQKHSVGIIFNLRAGDDIRVLLGNVVSQINNPQSKLAKEAFGDTAINANGERVSMLDANGNKVTDPQVMDVEKTMQVVRDFLGFDIRYFEPTHSFSSTAVRAGFRGKDKNSNALTLEQICTNLSFIEYETLKAIIKDALRGTESDPYNIRENLVLLKSFFEKYETGRLNDANKRFVEELIDILFEHQDKNGDLINSLNITGKSKGIADTRKAIQVVEGIPGTMRAVASKIKMVASVWKNNTDFVDELIDSNSVLELDIAKLDAELVKWLKDITNGKQSPFVFYSSDPTKDVAAFLRDNSITAANVAGKTVTRLIDIGILDSASGRQHGFNVALPYSRSGIYLASRVAVAQGDVNKLDNLTRTTLQRIYEPLLAIEAGRTLNWNQIFVAPWTVLPAVASMSSLLGDLRQAIIAVDTAA